MRFTLAALLATAASGCAGSGAFTRAADAYGKATQASASAIADVPRLADQICRKRARLAYVQNRLGLLDAPQRIPWNDWYATAKATDKQTFQEYCGELAASGKVFSAALGALSQYAGALRSLAESGKYDGSDLQAVVLGTGTIAGSLGSDAASAAVKPAGSLLGDFATFLLDGITGDKMEDYVRRADPLVQPLVESLEKYVAALGAQVGAAESFERDTLRALEVRSGLDPRGPDAGAPPDTGKLMAFYGLAVTAEVDMQATRDALGGYRRVLQRIRAAHGAMVRAGARGDDADVKKVAGSIAELVGELQALGSALSH
jgi:hypothetical protein